MMQDYNKAAEQISLFCRININTKKELPIRSSEMGLLIYLIQTDVDVTPMGAARFFNVTKAMITNMVTVLIRKGYLIKKQLRVDRRSYILIPTEKARQIVEETYEEYFKSMVSLEGKMGRSDFDKLISLLEKANNALLEDRNNG